MARKQPNSLGKRSDRAYGPALPDVSELFSVNSSELSASAADSFLMPIEGDFDRPNEASTNILPFVDPDEAVKQAFLSGSEEAFLRLYAKYEVSLFYYCKRMLHNEWAAEDAFQELWMRVFELRKRKGISIGHFRGLLFRSARNLCFNTLRNERYEESLDVNTEDWPEHETREELKFEEPMTGMASGREIQSLMVKALRKLPFDQRETFVLHEYSGFNYAEIAEMMGVPERNVKVRAHRARVRLRKFIQSWLGLGEMDDPANYI